MLEVYDKELKKIAILENAVQLSEEIRINSVGYFYFSLPYNDSKTKYCKPFHFIRYNDGDFYRIMPKTIYRNENGLNTYQCEHAIVTLIDKVLYGYHTVGGRGYYTDEVIRYVLAHQQVKHWQLDICEFNRQFEYGWEQESLLSALFSIPNCFADKHIWTYDFSAYPWKLSLKALDENAKPAAYVRNKKNLLSLEVVSDPTMLCTRLYPLGYGEGVNQLGISDINDGVPYLQSSQAIVDEYGIIERVWIDRRYEDAESLKAAAQAMLAELEEPVVQTTITLADLDKGVSGDDIHLGAVIRIIDTETDTDIKTYVTGINRAYGDIPSLNITISNKSTSIAETVADLADRQRIEQAYAQGATNLYSQSLQGNADSESGLKLNFFIPAEMRIVNKVQAKIVIDQFRSYSSTTESGGGFYGTTESGGGYYGTTESGGGFYGTTETGVAAEWTGTEIWEDGWASGSPINIYPDGGHNHGIRNGTGLITEDEDTVWFASSGEHDHFAALRKHRHIVVDVGHDHEVEIDDHSHDVEMDDHSHDVEIEDHEHEITPGIYMFGNPSAFTLFVNGVQKAVVQDTGDDIELTEYLVEDGSIPRGVWHEIEIRPNDLAYISIDMFVQGFIQSRGDNTV